jgi:hypothetical protein
VLANQQQLGAGGPDCYVCSLREAVTRCLEVAQGAMMPRPEPVRSALA